MRVIHPQARFCVPVHDYAGASLWLSSLGAPVHPRLPLKGEMSCDVAIAGAGFTGLWTAYFLKKACPDLDIVMLDAHVAGYGASGRNGGWCAAEMLHLEEWLDDPRTHGAACALQRALFETVRKIGAIVRAEGIDCDYARDGALTVARSAGELRRLEGFARKMARVGFTDDFIVLDRAAALGQISAEAVVGGLFTPHCAAIQPARLARGLARILELQGVRIFERSPVSGISPRSLDAASGTVLAPLRILACEGYTPSIAGFARALAPVHSRMIATAPLSEAQWRASGLNGRLCFGDARRLVSYAQLTADRRIVFGARGDYLFANGIEDRLSLDDPCTDFVRGRFISLFPQFEDVAITHAWTGPLGVARSRRPFMFFDRAAGFAWAGGYLGAGVAASCLVGEKLAGAIGNPGRPYSDDLFGVAEPPGKFEPEPLRWAGIEIYRRWLALLDALEL